MDTADGILSGAPRERALEIMKDHNVGAMGVAAAVLLLVLKVAALGALARADAAAPLLAGWCAARALPALNVYWWPYARPAGTGEAFTREHTPGPLQLAGGLLVAGVVVAGLAGLWAGAAGSWYAGLVVAAVVHGRRARRAGRRGEAARRPHRRRLRHGHRARRGGRPGHRLRHRRPGDLMTPTTTEDVT